MDTTEISIYLFFRIYNFTKNKIKQKLSTIFLYTEENLEHFTKILDLYNVKSLLLWCQESYINSVIFTKLSQKYFPISLKICANIFCRNISPSLYFSDMNYGRIIGGRTSARR